MKKGRSKSKGSAFERFVCQHLTQWLTGQNRRKYFWRSPASGGLASIDELNKDLSGDIRAIHPDAEFFTNIFSIEAKNGYPNTNFWQHFKGLKNFNIKIFWEQCVSDAKKANKLPMLIYKKKGQKPVIGINEYVDAKIGLTELPYILLNFSDFDNIVFYDMENFFEVVKPEQIKEHFYGNAN